MLGDEVRVFDGVGQGGTPDKHRAKDEDEEEKHGFPSDRLDKAVQDICKDDGRDARPAELAGVLVHAGFPEHAGLLHMGHPLLKRAAVQLLVALALRDFDQLL